MHPFRCCFFLFCYLCESVFEKCSFKLCLQVYLFTNAASRLCFSFCLDAKRNKRSRLRLQPDPLSSRKLRQIKMIIADIYLSFNAFFVQRVPRASAEAENLTDEG